MRDVIEGIITDPQEIVSERVGDVTFQFKAGESFSKYLHIFSLIWWHTSRLRQRPRGLATLSMRIVVLVYSRFRRPKFEQVAGGKLVSRRFAGRRRMRRLVA